MSTPVKFRTALNGFNREDVAAYLEYLNNKQTAQINQLTSEADFLRSRIENMPTGADQSGEIAALENDRKALQSQLSEVQSLYNDLLGQHESLKARCAALEQELADAKNAPVAAPAPVVPAASNVYTSSEELEIYRRAERTERMARERADLVYRQTSGILSEASIRVNEMADQVVPIADLILTQITQLQSAVNNTKQSLQDAVVIINTLRPDGN